jgi:hypothetical protein
VLPVDYLPGLFDGFPIFEEQLIPLKAKADVGSGAVTLNHAAPVLYVLLTSIMKGPAARRDRCCHSDYLAPLCLL